MAILDVIPIFDSYHRLLLGSFILLLHLNPNSQYGDRRIAAGSWICTRNEIKINYFLLDYAKLDLEIASTLHDVSI